MCGPLLGACVAVYDHWLDPPREEGELGGVFGGGYIYMLVTPVQPGKHGDIPELFLWLDVDSNNKSPLGYKVERISQWYTCVVLFHF